MACAAVSRGVGKDQDLRGTGDHVDADGAEDLTLGRRHIGIAGADDNVDRRDGLGPIGQRRDRLGAADPVDLGHPGAARGGQDQGIERTVGRRHGHHETLDPGDPGGQRVHQDRGGIGRRAAGHIETGGRDGGPALTQTDTLLVPVIQIPRPLAFVEGLDSGGRQIERRKGLGRAGGVRLRDLRLRDAQLRGRQLQAVEALGKVDQRRVTARLHRRQDLGDDPADVLVRLALGGEQIAETRLETGVGDVQSKRHRQPPESARSSGSPRRAGS
jgi:hypothetical protein